MLITAGRYRLEELKLDYTLKPMDFSEKYSGITNRKYPDLALAGITITDERKSDRLFDMAITKRSARDGESQQPAILKALKDLDEVVAKNWGRWLREANIKARPASVPER